MGKGGANPTDVVTTVSGGRGEKEKKRGRKAALASLRAAGVGGKLACNS